MNEGQGIKLSSAAAVSADMCGHSCIRNSRAVLAEGDFEESIWLKVEVWTELWGAHWGRWIPKQSTELWARGEARTVLDFQEKPERQEPELKMKVREPQKWCWSKLSGRRSCAIVMLWWGVRGAFKSRIESYLPQLVVTRANNSFLLKLRLLLYKVGIVIVPNNVCSVIFSHVWLVATPWTVAHQVPLFMGLSRQEYWSGLPCPPPGFHRAPPGVSGIAGRFFTTQPPGKPT